MHLLLVSHLLGRYMILVIFPTPVEPFLVPLPEVVVYFLIKGHIDSVSFSQEIRDQRYGPLEAVPPIPGCSIQTN